MFAYTSQFQTKTKQNKLKQNTSQETVVQSLGKVLPAGVQEPCCEPISGTYLGDICHTQGLVLLLQDQKAGLSRLQK